MEPADYHHAIEQCNMALEVSPKYSKVLLKRARCYEALDRLDFAAGDVDVVLRREPNNVTAMELSDRVRKELESRGIKLGGRSAIPVPEPVPVNEREKPRKKKSHKAEDKAVVKVEILENLSDDVKLGTSEQGGVADLEQRRPPSSRTGRMAAVVADREGRSSIAEGLATPSLRLRKPFSLFGSTFNQCMEDDENGQGSDSDSEENGRPSFSSVAKRAGFLDKELAASGFTRNEQEEIEKFIEGVQPDSESSEEDNLHTQDESNVDVPALTSLHLSDQQFEATLCDKDVVEENIPPCASENNVPEGNQDGTSCERETLQDTEAGDPQDDDATFHKRLVKQRRRAIAAAHGGRKTPASRNSYKEKGGKSSRTIRKYRGRSVSGNNHVPSSEEDKWQKME